MNKTQKTISIILLILGTISLIAGIVWQVTGARARQPLFGPIKRGDFHPPERSDMPTPLDESTIPERIGFRPWMRFNLPILLIGGGACLLLAGIVLLLAGNRKKEDPKTPATIKKPEAKKEVKSK